MPPNVNITFIIIQNIACTSKGKDLRTHFKNTFHVGRAIKGMLLTKAEEYLKDVLEHKRCVPFSRYDHSVGRCSAAIQFGLTKGRYPEKSVKIMLNLLKNAKANAESKKLNVDKLLIKNVLVNQATEGRRRTYRAHGSINAYCSSNCHVEIICEEIKDRVKKEKKEEGKINLINPRKHIRKALARHMCGKKIVKLVPVGGGKWGKKKEEKK